MIFFFKLIIPYLHKDFAICTFTDKITPSPHTNPMGEITVIFLMKYLRPQVVKYLCPQITELTGDAARI